MKKRILTIAAMLFLGIMIPISVNAATISVEPKEMLVNDTVTVTVTVDTADTEAVQFDLDFDDTKYQYILGSAKSELDSTGSNLLDKDTVRASTFNFNTTETAHTVELKFKAIATGSSIPFKVTSLEATDGTGTITTETLAEPTATVAKIGPAPVTETQKPTATVPGNKLPDTGDVTRATAKKSIAGVYTKLMQGSLVVPYALPTSDDVLTPNDVKAEFGDSVDVTNLSNPVKSGESFTLNGQQHIVLIYGDVNKDGKVTTADALIIRKYELNVLAPDSITTITSDVATTMEDSKAVQQFVLRLRQSKTKTTILDVYPVEFAANDINFVSNATSVLRGERTLIATISAKDGRTLTEDLLANISIANVTIDTDDSNGTIQIYATSNSSNKINFAPSLEAKNIENTKITGANQEITVEEVKSVTYIALFDKNGKEITNNLTLIAGEKPTLTIKYYHEYADGSREELTEENTTSDYFNGNRVKLTKSNTTSIFQTAVLVNNPTDLHTSSLNFLHALHIQSQASGLGSETLTIRVTNDISYKNTPNYVPIYSKELTIIVANEPIKALRIDGKVKNAEEHISMNIYKNEQPNNKKTYYVDDSDGTSVFTIIDIDFLTDNSTSPSKLTRSRFKEGIRPATSNSNTLDCILLSQNSDPTDAMETRFQYYVKDSNGDYHPTDGANVEIDAIGFSYYDDYDTSIDMLKDGFTISYAGTMDSNGNITYKHIFVDVIPVGDTARRTPAAPQVTTSTEPSESTEPTTSATVEPTTSATVEPTESIEPTETDEPTTSVTPSTTPVADDDYDPFDNFGFDNDDSDLLDVHNP